jgi:hypothetical protein
MFLSLSLEIRVKLLANQDVAAIVDVERGLDERICAYPAHDLTEHHFSIFGKGFWCGVVGEIGVVFRGQTSSPKSTGHELRSYAAIP